MSAHDKLPLPPLASLRVFDAVARFTSLKEAANELGLTASAVSHQIRNLEEYLGVVLFQRRNRGIELTATGAAFATHVQQAFRELQQAMRGLRESPDSAVLHVSAPPVFATEMIVPHLHDFERRHPKIQVRLEMSEMPVDLNIAPIDVAIRLGPAPPPTFYSEKLLDLDITPVCSPRLLEGPRGIRRIEDLRSHAAVTLTNQPVLLDAWTRWMATAGHGNLKPARELRFDTFAGILQAAESGLGFTFAPPGMIARRRREGRLVAPFPVVVALPWVCRFVCRRGQERLLKIDSFRRWIKELFAAQSFAASAL